jgi:hypothetical protein
MLIGFSKYGTGSAARPIDYLTAETVHAGNRPGKTSAAPVSYLTGKSGKKGVRREPSPVVVADRSEVGGADVAARHKAENEDLVAQL